MARTLRRSCPPHTRIVRKSGSATSSGSASASPVAASSKASNYSHDSTSPSSSYASPTSSSYYGVAYPSYPVATSQIRSFHSNARYLYATKDTQDKDSLKPISTEYSKSGSDDAAAHDDAAFDPNQTSPETEAKNMGESENPVVSIYLRIAVCRTLLILNRKAIHCLSAPAIQKLANREILKREGRRMRRERTGAERVEQGVRTKTVEKNQAK